MIGGGGGRCDVREWGAQPAALLRCRVRFLLVAGVVIALLGAGFVLEGDGLPATALGVGALGLMAVATAAVRRPVSKGPAPLRRPVTTDPAAAPPPGPADAAVERRHRRARVVASLVLVVAAPLGHHVSRHPGEDPTLLSVFVGLGLYVLLTVDLPWLYDTRRLGARPLVRTTLTVRAVGVPGRGLLVLTCDTLAWTALRTGVLADAVVGDVLVADVDARDHDPVVLTLGDRRTVSPKVHPLTAPRLRAIVADVAPVRTAA